MLQWNLEKRFDCVFEQESYQQCGNAGEQDIPAQSRIIRQGLEFPQTADIFKGSDQDRPQVLPEVDNQRQQRAELDDDQESGHRFAAGDAQERLPDQELRGR